MELYSFNLKARDCRLSARLYAEVFGGRVLQAGDHHAEIQIQDYRILLDHESPHCPVQPGTLTITGQPDDIDRLVAAGFRRESTPLNKPYASVVDRDHNRIWIYFKESEF